MEIPRLVIKVENDTGDEILRAKISTLVAGRFLQYLGQQLEALSGIKTQPAPHIPSKVEKEGKDHA